MSAPLVLWTTDITGFVLVKLARRRRNPAPFGKILFGNMDNILILPERRNGNRTFVFSCHDGSLLALLKILTIVRTLRKGVDVIYPLCVTWLVPSLLQDDSQDLQIPDVVSEQKQFRYSRIPFADAKESLADKRALLPCLFPDLRGWRISLHNYQDANLFSLAASSATGDFPDHASARGRSQLPLQASCRA